MSAPAPKQRFIGFGQHEESLDQGAGTFERRASPGRSKVGSPETESLTLGLYPPPCHPDCREKGKKRKLV